jgi:hypothetical protein
MLYWICMAAIAALGAAGGWFLSWPAFIIVFLLAIAPIVFSKQVVGHDPSGDGGLACAFLIFVPAFFFAVSGLSTRVFMMTYENFADILISFQSLLEWLSNWVLR